MYVDDLRLCGVSGLVWDCGTTTYLPPLELVSPILFQVPFKYVDDLATVWCEWAEMELRHNNFKAALELMRQATAVPQRPKKLSQQEERLLPVQERLYRLVR
jgi:pre-mRNA-splicing factor SYF1